MKETRSVLRNWLVCGLAMAMVSTLAAQTPSQGVAKVVRLKGLAKYITGSNAGQLIKVGDEIKPGTVIQTASKSSVVLRLGDGSVPTARPVGGQMLAYRPDVDQNVVYVWENSLLGIDKLSFTKTGTGADEVTDTQLDLKAGHIFGMVKKMSAASKYEVKIPNGVAGIRGTVYDLTADGVIKVLSGSAVLAYVGADGTVMTQVVMSNQQFDLRTGTLTPLPDRDKADMERLVKQIGGGYVSPPAPVSQDKTLIYVSPH